MPFPARSERQPSWERRFSQWNPMCRLSWLVLASFTARESDRRGEKEKGNSGYSVLFIHVGSQWVIVASPNNAEFVLDLNIYTHRLISPTLPCPPVIVAFKVYRSPRQMLLSQPCQAQRVVWAISNVCSPNKQR